MKRIKDPAYGYVEIPDNIVYSIIDTAEFQRLRDVIQTSYNAVYPSALHNRFVHSIGVYYLGCIAATGIIEGIDADEKENSVCDRTAERTVKKKRIN